MRRILILAYEYPPILAAQSLRWFYLANALAEKDDLEVHVLTTNIRDIWGFSGELHPRIKVHRSFPGPFVGLSGYLAQRTDSGGSTPIKPAAPGVAARLYGRIRALLNQVLFPDVRSEWFPFAWRAIRRLHVGESFQIIISSHEPGVDLLLGRRLKKRYPHLHWIVDLADPLLTPYTPHWRCALDKHLERRICQEADRILITNNVVKTALISRYGGQSGKNLAPFTQITQGFGHLPDVLNAQLAEFAATVLLPEKQFTLLFTGNFYPGFRDPHELIQAVAKHPGIRLMIAGNPGPFGKLLSELPEQVTTLGVLDHFRCLALQQHATVLINLANEQVDQVPGKLYEYLGAGRPILHIGQSAQDEGGKLIKSMRRGEIVANHALAIEGKLAKLYRLWQEHRLEQSYELSLGSVAQYHWNRLGEVLYQNLPQPGR